MQQVIFKKEHVHSDIKKNDKHLAFINSFKEMDILAIERLLEDDMLIGEQSKWEFLSDIKRKFDIYRSGGVTSMELHIGKCMNCFKGCDVHIFREVKYKGEIVLYINVDEAGLETIKQCRNHSKY